MDEAVASVGGNLYTFGGISNNLVVASANRFDGTTWSSIAPVPVAVEYAAAVSDGTNIYIVGGVDSTGIEQAQLYRYNVGANSYTILAPCGTATWSHAAAYLGGKVYKFGGTIDSGASTNVLEIYNIATNTWTNGAAYPTSLSFISAWAAGGFIYAAGGLDSTTSNESNKTYRYDPASNTWNDLAVPDLFAPRWGAASAVFTSCLTNGLIMAGGYSGGSIASTALVYDTGTNTWSNLNLMVGERARMNGAVLGGNFYVIGGRSNASPNFVGTADNQQFSCPCSTPTPTPTPSPTYAISGTVGQCNATGPSGILLPGVTMTLTGAASGSVTTDGSGNYAMSGLFAGNYTVTPSKAARAPASAGITTIDVLGVQRHFLGISLLSGCRLTAADCAPPSGITTVDVIAIQRFFLGFTTGIGNVGKYGFIPDSRTYTPLNGTQTGQDFDTVVFGDVSPPFAFP
jgi:hypothetical protein